MQNISFPLSDQLFFVHDRSIRALEVIHTAKLPYCAKIAVDADDVI